MIGPNPALAHLDLIHGADRSNLRRGSSEESFVGDVEHLARNHLLDNRDAKVARDLQRRIAGDAGQHGVPQRRRDQLLAMHDEHVLARAFTDKAIHVERNALGKAVDDGFHLDELRVHVIRARLRHGRQGVRRNPRPRRDAGVAAVVLAAQIFSPRIIDDVDLGGRVERIHSRLAIAAENNGPHVARPYAVTAHGFDHRLH